MRRLPVALGLLGLVVAGVAALGIGVRATDGGRTAVDEPEYLLTAISLAEDGDLDISDELAQRRWRAFHEAELPVQTRELAGGREVSPHDPLLAALLALPVALGGWVAAKVVLAVLAGVTAALTCWVAVRRFGVPLAVAWPGVALGFCSPPLAVYGTQVYPELPAAAAVMVAVAALTGPLRTWGCVTLAVAVVALPWLSVKYVPVAGVLAVLALVRLLRGGHRRRAAALGGALAVMATAYAGLHAHWYGGMTAYATGDHFEGTGQLAVVGTDPDYVGRTLRLAALLVDHDYGLAGWQPAWLVLPLAVGCALRLRTPGTAALLLPLAAGWAVATWAALTMHGYWFPGRQLVVVLPVGLLLVLRVLAVAGPRLRTACAVLAAGGALIMGALLVAGLRGELTWVVDHTGTNPVRAGVSALLPDYRAAQTTGWWLGHVLWCAVLVALVGLGWRRGRRGVEERAGQRPRREVHLPTPGPVRA